jgi:predicted amidophosphoribosyltransferase
MMRRGLALLERLARPLLLAEARCPGCGVVAAGLGAALCADCLSELGAADGPACPGCGRPGESPGNCPECRAEPRPWNRLAAFGAYDGRLRELLLAYKFEARLDLGRQLQECLDAAFGRALAEHPEFAACEMIVPVPLHPA